MLSATSSKSVRWAFRKRVTVSAALSSCAAAPRGTSSAATSSRMRGVESSRIKVSSSRIGGSSRRWSMPAARSPSAQNSPAAASGRAGLSGRTASQSDGSDAGATMSRWIVTEPLIRPNQRQRESRLGSPRRRLSAATFNSSASRSESGGSTRDRVGCFIGNTVPWPRMEPKRGGASPIGTDRVASMTARFRVVLDRGA